MSLVRKASLADVSLVVSFIEKQARYDLQLGCLQGTFNASSERIKAALFGSPTLAYALLISSGALPAGLAIYQYRFSPIEGRASVWIDLIHVDEAARRRGCGAALMQAIGREAALRDCISIAWTLDERNIVGSAFFAKLRAPVVSRQDRRFFYSLSPEHLAAREPEKRLRQTRPPLPTADESRSPLTASAAPFGVPQRMTSYKTLVAADIYRDGGSLEVRFECADGTHETIWLQASVDPDFGVRYIHTDLLIFADANRQGVFCSIEKESAAEDAVLDALMRFLRYPKVAVPFSHRTPDAHYLETVEMLIKAIPNRVPRNPEQGATRP
jgi:GNAT superfamily N-acetyltransferase